MAKGNVLGNLFDAKVWKGVAKSASGYDMFSNPKKFFTKKGIEDHFDPGHVLFPTKDKVVQPPLPVDAAAAEARDAERRRLAIGAGQRSSQIVSANSLSGNLGKSSLGGSY